MEDTTPQIMSSYRSPPWVANRRENDLTIKAVKTGDETAKKGQGPLFDIPRDSLQTIVSSLGVKVASPTTNFKPTSTHFESYTPATASSASGPLKKRIKHRYSLDSTSFLPLTPSGYFNFTPDIDFRKNDNPVRISDIKVLPFRMPFTEMSPNATSDFQDATDKNEKKSNIKLTSSPMKAKRKKPDNYMSFSSLTVSSSAMRNHKLRSPTVLPKSSQRYLSTPGTPARLVVPARARQIAMLPIQSPISSKARNDVDRSSGRSSVSFANENRNSYMCLIRQQLEFFEISPEDVALCKARNVSVELGQVALRCRHCTCISAAFRPKGSLVIAKMHRSLYKHFNHGFNSHIEEMCPFVSKATKNKLKTLRSLQDSFQGQNSFWQDFGYWCAQAKAQGVVETHRGLRFKSSLIISRDSALGFTQHNTKNLLLPVSQKNSTLCAEKTRSALSPLAVDLVHPAHHRQNQSLKEKRLNSIECPLKSSQNCIVPKKPKSTVGRLLHGTETKQCDERNHHKGAKPLSQHMEEAHTLCQRAAIRTWFQRLEEFIAFKDRNGHGRVPQYCPKNRSLGIWVNRQRMAKRAKDAGKASNMTDEKIKRLEKAGFTWAKGHSAWDEKFCELQKYFEKNGHCDVPTKSGNNKAAKVLGRWVSTQRKHYKNYMQSGLKSSSVDINEMDRRIQLLDGINFSWSLLPNCSVSKGGNDGDDSYNLEHVIAPTSAFAKSASPKPKHDISTLSSSRTADDKKCPPPQLDISYGTLNDCSSDLLSGVKLEDQSVEFFPIFDHREGKLSF